MYLELRNKDANRKRINFIQPAHAPTAVGSALLFGFQKIHSFAVGRNDTLCKHIVAVAV